MPAHSHPEAQRETCGSVGFRLLLDFIFLGESADRSCLWGTSLFWLFPVISQQVTCLHTEAVTEESPPPPSVLRGSQSPGLRVSSGATGPLCCYSRTSLLGSLCRVSHAPGEGEEQKCSPCPLWEGHQQRDVPATASPAAEQGLTAVDHGPYWHVCVTVACAW